MASDTRHDKANQGKPETASKKSQTNSLDHNPNKDDAIDEGPESSPARSVRRSEYESYYRDF
jgi:hypothetical protein